jgi:hypothetical protein
MEAVLDAPLLVDGESRGECGELTMHCDGKLVSVVRNRVTPTDNHIHVMADGFSIQSCVLSRTDAGATEFQQLAYRAKGFTWYIRFSHACGEGIIGYFKDIEMAMESMSLFAEVEQRESEFGLPTHDNNMREYREMLMPFNWKIHAEL